eukprot:1194382-Prorocentrum_minimum.AAC.1
MVGVTGYRYAYPRDVAHPRRCHPPMIKVLSCDLVLGFMVLSVIHTPIRHGAKRTCGYNLPINSCKTCLSLSITRTRGRHLRLDLLLAARVLALVPLVLLRKYTLDATVVRGGGRRAGSTPRLGPRLWPLGPVLVLPPGADAGLAPAAG